MQLGETLAADGRWRLMAFAGKADGASPSSSIAKLCQFLTDSPQSPLKRFTTAGSDVDSVFDVRAVFQQSHHTLAVTDLPALLFPQKGRYGLHDYEKAFCNIDEPSQDIYALRNINRELGCLVVVRPDQYIAYILPLDDADALAASLTTFFDGFMLNAGFRFLPFKKGKTPSHQVTALRFKLGSLLTKHTEQKMKALTWKFGGALAAIILRSWLVAALYHYQSWLFKAADGAPKSVLWVGNSFFYYNNSMHGHVGNLLSCG